MAEDQQPATKADIAQLAARMDQLTNRTEQLANRTEQLATQAQLEASELRLAARLERAETALLNGFRNYATQQEVRTSALESRSAMFERRLTEVEFKLGMQPPPQQP